MVLMFLLDTNIISELARAHPNPGVTKAIRQHQEMMAIPSLVWHEMLYGVERLATGQRKSALARFLRDVVAPIFPVLPYRDHEASIHAHFRAIQEGDGFTVPFVDGQIAAIAMANNLILVSRNTSDFAHIPGLMLENWYQE